MCLGTERQTLKAGQAVVHSPGRIPSTHQHGRRTPENDLLLCRGLCSTPAAGNDRHPAKSRHRRSSPARWRATATDSPTINANKDGPNANSTNIIPASGPLATPWHAPSHLRQRPFKHHQPPQRPCGQPRRTASDRSQLRLCGKYRHPRTGNLRRSNDHVLANRQMPLRHPAPAPAPGTHHGDTGVMPVEIYIDECHKQGMEFIAGFRMNDRHGHHTEFFKKLCDEKPEWVLREYKPSTRRAPPESRKYGCSLNYAVPELRAFLLAIMEAVANRFDIDGMEFNFTRLAECFPRAELSHSHSTMTGFIRQVRNLLDNAHSPTGRDRNLILGVRVPQQMAGCKNLSLDVPTWIQEGLINYVAPGDFGFTDFNEKYEDFVSIARQHDCYVYPQVQPRLSIDTEFLMDMPQYRAALQNFYAAGADGFSTQNYFFHWGPQFEPPGTNGTKTPQCIQRR